MIDDDKRTHYYESNEHMLLYSSSNEVYDYLNHSN